jgi:hypothetical protein
VPYQSADATKGTHVTQEDLWGGPFSAAQLERCILFDPRRGMRGQTGEDAIASLLETAEEWQKRGRRPIDAVSLRSTAGSFLANLIVAAKNRVDTQRFVALSFRRADYAGTPLSTEALAVLRDQWLAKGLVEGRVATPAEHGCAPPHAFWIV